jgi:hypothetical protein
MAGTTSGKKRTGGSKSHAAGPAPLDPALALIDGEGQGALTPLAQSLGRSPDAQEALAWATMSPSNREMALKRIDVLKRWEKRSFPTAADAANELGLKIARFYDLAARWKAGDRRLFTVGTFVKGQSERKGRFDAKLMNELQSALPGIVERNEHLPVIQQVRLLLTAVDPKGRKLPGENTLREMVDREHRRRLTRRQAGTEPAFDFIGSGLWRESGGQHLIYAVIDRTSSLILGVAVGTFEESRSYYAAAAADALVWFASSEASGVAWAGVTERIDVVPAADVDWWRELDRDAAPVTCGLADGTKSPGRYFRACVGPKLGRLKLSALATATQGRDGVDAVDEDIALLQVKVEVAAHNAAVKAEMTAVGDSRPAPTTVAAMAWVSGLAPRG